MELAPTKRATVTIGGHQYIVEEGDSLEVDYQSSAAEATMTFSEVSMVQVGSEADPKAPNILVGKPYVAGASVEAKIDTHLRAPKILVFKKKRRKNYKRTKGHRQNLTRLTITKIQLGQT